MKRLTFLLGLVLGALLLLLPVSQFQSSPLAPLQTLAVQLEGRKKPLDTVAQETVAKIHGSSQYQQADGTTLNYWQTYLALWFNDRDWNQEPFILFTHRPLKEQLGFSPEQKYFSFQDLMGSPALGAVVRSAHAQQAEGEELSREQREALTLEDRLELMLQTVGTDQLPLVPHPQDPLGKWLPLDQTQTYYDRDQEAELRQDRLQLEMAYNHLNSDLNLDLPPFAPDTSAESLAPHATPWTALREAGAKLHQSLVNLSPQVYPPLADLQREVHFNGFHPFAKAWHLYGLSFIVMLLALWIKPQDLYGVALGLFSVGLGVQTYGFILRMQIAGRPPVTNMYESVVWVGFGIAALAFLFEWTTRARYYLLAAAPLSILCLLLADNLPAVLDPSIAPLVPVLRDNFWLSIHVPTITLSYASFALALGLGHVALGHTLWSPQSRQRIQTLSQLNYRVLQVGVLLLTAGIILGGIWAHVSWGRFWGWDPKETWALIALLCYLIPLHGRLVGWIGPFGLNVASIVAFNGVLMAWYGVNFVLGTGLHSYGFSTGSSEWIIAGIVGLDLLFVLLATLRHWRSSSLTDVQPSPESDRGDEAILQGVKPGVPEAPLKV
jgi:cytochrome c-type biogenesis protein CcsB